MDLFSAFYRVLIVLAVSGIFATMIIFPLLSTASTIANLLGVALAVGWIWMSVEILYRFSKPIFRELEEEE